MHWPDWLAYLEIDSKEVEEISGHEIHYLALKQIHWPHLHHQAVKFPIDWVSVAGYRSHFQGSCPACMNPKSRLRNIDLGLASSEQIWRDMCQHAMECQRYWSLGQVS